MKKKHIGKKRNPKRKGFTLVELLGAILILAIISGIAIFSYSSIVNKSKTEVFKVYEHTMYSETIALLTDYVDMIPKNNETKLYSLSDIGIDPIINPRNKNDLCLNSYVKVTRNDYDDEVHVDGFTYKVCLICLDSNYISDEENCGVVPLPSNTPKSKLSNATNSVEITGTVAYGETLTANVTTNSNGVISYQWYSNTIQSTSDGTEIPGATGSTYTIGSGLTGKYIYVKSSVAASKKYKRAQDAFAITETAVGKKNNVINVTTPETWETTYSTSNQTKEITEVTGARGNVTYEIYSQKNSEEVDINNFSMTGRAITMEGNTGAGNYTLVVRATDEGNNEYASAFGDITLNVTVAKANSTITCNETQDYTGSAITAYSASTGCSSYTNGTVTDAGTYTVTCVGDANHNNSTCEFTVNKATVTVTAPVVNTNSLTYTGNGQTLFTSSGSCSTGGTMYWYGTATTASTAPSFDASTWTTTAPARTAVNAGTWYYYYYCQVTDTTNYTGTGINTVNRVSKAISKVDAVCPTIDNWDVLQDGKQHSIVVSGGSGGTIQYKWNSTSDSWRDVIPTASVLGSWVVYVQVLGDSNHNTKDCSYKTVTIYGQTTLTYEGTSSSGSVTFSGINSKYGTPSASSGNVTCGNVSSNKVTCTITGISGSTAASNAKCKLVTADLPDKSDFKGDKAWAHYYSSQSKCYYQDGHGPVFYEHQYEGEPYGWTCRPTSMLPSAGGHCPNDKCGGSQTCYEGPKYQPSSSSTKRRCRCLEVASSRTYYTSTVTLNYY